jgi:hypothetical protein
MSRSLENFIRFSRCRSFEGARDLSDLKLGADEQMNVIRHDRVRVQTVVVQFVGTSKDCLDHELRDARILQPKRTGARAVENSFGCLEFLSIRELKVGGPSCRERTVQPPREENRLFFRQPVRKASLVKAHAEPAGTTGPSGRTIRKSTSVQILVYEMGQGICAERPARIAILRRFQWHRHSCLCAFAPAGIADKTQCAGAAALVADDDFGDSASELSRVCSVGASIVNKKRWSVRVGLLSWRSST